ncbi:MAG: protein kinase [Phycisphaerae bacterium]
MAQPIACPHPDRLQAYALDELGPQETLEFDRHLSICRTCLDQVLHQVPGSVSPKVPNCHVICELGRGHFGVVYKAWWVKHQPRLVALKVLGTPGLMQEARFDREASVLKKIDSPGVVHCLESGMAGQSRYFIMDHVQGQHLDEHVNALGDDLNAKLEVFERVCRAVADAHRAGVVHRDLKPSNILIDPQGQPHVVDFGICGLDRPDWNSPDYLTITNAGDIVGTLKYMSPEQAWGRRIAARIDKPTDIWSLGIMLCEIVTGGYPYSLRSTADKPSHEALLDRIRKELPQLPRLAHLPRGRDLEILLERCLSWEPDHRVESADRLADDLGRYRVGQPIKTRPHGPVYKIKRLATAAATRSPLVFHAATVALLCTLLWGATYLLSIGWHVPAAELPGASMSATAATGIDDIRESTLIVGVFDDTVDTVIDFAAEHRIPGVNRALTSWRPVHGQLLKTLAAAKPIAVVWDYYFRSPQPHDALLAAGIEALEAAGTPVVLASLRYKPDGTPDLSPALTGPLGRRLRHGAISARDMVKRPGQYVTAIKIETGHAVPGLSLAVLAAVIHPQARLELDWPTRKNLSMLYELPGGAYLRERDALPLTRVFKAGTRQQIFDPDAILACNRFDLDTLENWRSRTVPYQELLTCSAERLRELAGGKLIVVGDFRQKGLLGRSDRHSVRYGHKIVPDVPGCYLLADSITGLLGGRYLKNAFPLPPKTLALVLLASTLGCLLPVGLCHRVGLARPSRRRHVQWALWILAMICFGVMVWSRSRWAVQATMAGSAALAAMAVGFRVEFARNRYRILDRQRRDLEGAELTTDTSSTLTLQPPISRPTAG